jgi:TP901 family phage tail tape measure protein
MAFDITGQLNLRLASGAIRNIASEINSGLRSSGVGAVNIPVKADTASIKSLSSQLDTVNSSVLKFAQQSGLALKRFAAFSLAAGPVMALGSAFRSAASEALSFDKEMLRLRQVSMDVGGEVKSIAAEVTRLSVGFGVSSQELIKTAVVLKQANLSIDETRIALEALAKSALAPNFDSMAQTTEGAIAVMNQFKIESKDLEQALGSMNAVAGEFAVEAGDLIEVVRRTGGAFKASGGDLNELMAIFTSVRQTTRESAESISTGLRTIFTRLQRNETVSQLKSIGVELRYTRAEAEQMGNIKLTDQFVGAYEAVHRLSQALAQIPESDSRFASISEELGGYRQIGKVIPMLKEFAVSERALMVAEAGRVSLQVNAAQAADSYGNRLTKLSESYAAFGRTVMNTDTFKGAFSGFESLAKSILSVLDAARPLLPLLTAIAAVKLGSIVTPFLREAASGVTQIPGKKKFATGGLVPGSGNTDSVPVDLQPGSFVVRKSSVAKYGREAMSTLANGYARGGKVSAMVMPGEFIFTPAQVSSIGSSTLNSVNSGSLEKFADGTQPKSGSSIGDFFKKMIGLDDDSKARRKLSSMSMSDDVGANLKATADINKDPKVRNLLNKMEKQAIEKHGLQDLMAILPDIKGSRTIAMPSEDSYGYVHSRSRGNRVALTDMSFANQSKTGQINTLGHEIIHLLDRQAGLRFPGANKGDIGSKFLSENENSQTNKAARLLQSYVRKAVEKGYLQHSSGDKEEALKYYTSPDEILARVMEGGVSGNSQFTKTVGSSLPSKQRAQFYKQTQELEATFRKEVASLIEIDLDEGSKPSVSPRKPRRQGARPGKPQLPPPSTPPISSGSGSPFGDRYPDKSIEDLEREIKEIQNQYAEFELDDHGNIVMSPPTFSLGDDLNLRDDDLPTAPKPARMPLQMAPLPAQKPPAPSPTKPSVKMPLTMVAPHPLPATIPPPPPPPTTPSVSSPTAPQKKRFVNKTIQSLAQSLGVDINAITGSGKGGALLKADIYAAAGVTPPAPGSSKTPASTPATTPVSILDRSSALGIDNSGPDPRKQWHHDLGVNDPSTAMNREKLNSQDTINLLSDMSSSKSLGGAEALEKSIFRKISANKPDISPNDARIESAKRASDILSSAESMRKAQDTVEAESGIKNQASSRISDMKRLDVYANRANSLKERADYDPVVKNQRDEVLQKMDAVKQRVAKNEGIDSNAIYDIDNGQYKISDAVEPLLKKLNRELVSIGRAAAENISEANKVIDEEKEKLSGIRAITTKDASGRRGVNFSGIDVGMNPAAPSKQITSPNGVVLNNTRDYGRELNDIAKNKNKVGFGASVTEELKQEDFANLLGDMSKNRDTKKLLQKSIYESLQSTRPDLDVGERRRLAKEQSNNIFDKANNFKNTKDEQFKSQALQSEYSLRSDSIKNLPAIVDKVNSLKELSRLDPSVGPELKKTMDQLKETVKTINSATGLEEKQYLSDENGKFSIRDAAKESLSRGMTQNQLMAETYGKQAKEAGKNAEVQLKDFDGMNASFIKDDVGRKGIRFGGDAGRYGAGPPEAPPGLPSGGLTLAQLRQNRISDSMAKIDPIGGGRGLSEITKAAMIEEETNKLRREYADGMAQIIMTERKINSLEAARAIATEEFNKNLHNHTLVMTKTDSLGNKVVDANVANRSSRPPSGSYGDLVATEYESIIKKKDPKGMGLSDVSKRRAMEEAEINIKNQYLTTISSQVQKARQLTSMDDALIIAEEMRIKAIDENTKVVRKGNKIYDKGLLDSGVTGKSSIGDIVKTTFESLKKTFLNLDMAIAGISVAGAYIGDAVSRSAGNAEDAARGGEDGSFVDKKGLGGAISGIGTGIGSGAFAGHSIGGPDSKAPMILGALGGVVGGLAGFVSALKDAEIEVSNVKIGESIKKIDEYLMNFAKGTVNFNAGYLRDQESIVDKEQPLKAANQLSTFYMPLYSNRELQDSVFSARKETAAQQVPARMDALSKIIEDRAKKEIGNGANMNEESRKKAFDDVLMENGGFGRAQLGQIASATGQDINLVRGKMLDMFKRIADNEAIRNKQEQSSSKINQSAVLFGNLSTALEISTQKLMEMSTASKNVTDVMDSNIGPFMGSGLASSLRQPFGAGREDFVNAIKTITDITGNNDDVVKQAETATMAGTLLPGIIAVIRSQPVANLARGENFGIQVGDTLQKALTAKGMDAGVSSSVVGMVQSQLGEEDFSKMLRESGQDMTKMVDTLLKPIVEPLTRNSEKMSKLMDDRAKDFADQIADMARRTRQKGEMMDAANDAEIAAVRNGVQISAKRGQVPESAAETDIFNLALRQQQLRQNRLTNFGNGNAFPNQQAVADAQNPDMIFDALQGVVAKIKKAERNVDELSKGKNINASNQAITELANLKGRAADLNQALKNLTDTSERNAAAQEKLGKIQNEREGRQSLGMRYATSNIEGRAEIAKAFGLLSSAAKMGTAAPFTARDQNQIFSLLSSLSPQMRLQGLGGATVKDITSQLLDTTFGGAFSLDPQTAAMERALENFVQQNYEVASRAAQLQVDNQTNLMSELFGRLENSQTKFLSELAKINKETAELMKQTLILRASEEVSKLEKGGGELSMLGNIGIKDNEQFEVLKALVKNPKINADLKQVVAKRNEAAGLDATLKEISTPEMLDLFSQNINRDIGGQDLGTVGGTSMGVVLRRLEDMGLSGDLQKEVFERFKINLGEKGGGKFKDRTNDVQEALRVTLKDVISGRANTARVMSDISERKLLNNGGAKIDPKILNNIAMESEKAFGKSNFADLETAIKAVETFGGKFEDFGKQLEAAKDKLKKLAEPEKKANGGLVRFFNKGGWGSGGSTTPHGADTVNARINPNEFVVAAGPAQRNKNLLEKINGGGLVGMADGGIVDEIYGNLNNAKSILSRQGKMIGGEKEINEAKRLARINSAAMFLVQLKDMPKDQREKLIDEQIKTLKDGPQNPFQEGIVDALNNIKEKRELQKSYEKETKEFQEKKNAPAYQNLLPDAEKIHDAVKARAVALSLTGAERIGNEEKIIQEIPDIRQKLAGRFNLNHENYRDSNQAILIGTGDSVLSQSLIKINKDRYDHFFGDKLDKNIPDSVFAQFRTVDGITYTTNEIEEFRNDPRKKRNVKGQKRNKAQIIKDIYSGNIEKHFEKNAWQSGINSLSPTKQEFMADTNEAFKAIRNKTLIPPIAFDYEESIKGVINAQLEEVKKEKEKNFGMVKAKEEIEKKVNDRRIKVFSTPQDQLSKAVGAINPMELGRKDMLGVIKAQNLAREAELFNQLNPALQAKYLEPLKASIRENGLDINQKEQFNFPRFAEDGNLTSEEIAIYARDKNKFSLLQRAYLEVMMEKVSEGKKPGNLNEAEKYAYLISLESQAKTKAYDQVQDKKNRAGLNRMGQFLSANPGLINARMSAAEEKGAEAYANEAALIEMVMSHFGTPTKIPGVFAVFKDKNLTGGKPADAGVQPKKPGIFDANEAGEMGGGKEKKANGGLIKFASGGLVPGVGNTDSVRANLPVGSYVIRKSSVNKLGADTLASLPHMATGGVVPAMVMPGEHIFTPDESSKIGKGKLDYINQNGKLPGYFYGGDVPGGQPGGKKVNAQGAAVFGGGVPNQNGQWVFMPNGANPWAAGMPINQGAMQNKAMPFGANANAGAIPLHAGPQNQMGVEQEFQQAMGANKIDLDRFALADKKTEYYQLRNKLTKSRVRSKEDIAKFRELHAELTNPFVVQADAAQRMLSAQEALAKFQESPKDFLEAAKRHRQVMNNPKANYKDRLLAKEMYEEYVLAARSIPPQALRAAMIEEKKPANNEIIEREWQEKRIAVQAHNRRVNDSVIKNGPEAVAEHNTAMEKKYGKKPTGPEAVSEHNAKMKEKYGEKISGPEAVKEHNAKVRAAEKARLEDIDKNKFGTKKESELTAVDKAIKEARGLKYAEKKQAEGPNVKYSWLPKYQGPELHRVHAERSYAKGDGAPVDLTGYNKLLESKFSDRIIDEPGISDKEKFIREYLASNADFESDDPVKRSKFAMGRPTQIDKEIRRQKELNEAQKPGLTGADIAIAEERARKEAERQKTQDQGGTEIDKAIRAARMRQSAEANLTKKAAGGIVPGIGSGDTVPAMLEPGELVVPKKHVQKFANGGVVGGIQGFANGGMAQGGGPELLDVAAKFNQAATQISQGLSGFSTSVSTFNGAVASFGTFVDKFDEAVGKIPGQIELSGANEISVNLMGQDSIVKAVTEAIGPMIAEAIRANQPVEQRSQ